MIRREPARIHASDRRAGVGVHRRRLVPAVRGRERLAGRGRPAAGQRLADDASGLAIMSVLVGVLKLAGAAVALAAVLAPPGLPRRPRRLLGVALWGAFGLLSLYSAGNLVITVGTVSGLLAPRGGLDRRRRGDRQGGPVRAVLPGRGGAVRGPGGLVSTAATTWAGRRRSPGWPARPCCSGCSWPP